MTAEPDGPQDRLRRFATIWSRSVYQVTSTSLTRPEFEEQLLPLAGRLSEALRARTFDAEEGRAVGAALVAMHCTDPEALSRSLDCVDAYLVLYCGEDGPQEDLRNRASRLQHAMAAGYAGRCASGRWPSRRRSRGPRRARAARSPRRCTTVRPASARSSRARP